MGHTVPTSSNPALSKRQRRKAYQPQPDMPATQPAHSRVDQFEPQICSQQLNTSRLFRDGAAQASASNKGEVSAGYPFVCSSQMCGHSSADQAAAAQSLIVRPALGLAAPSTGWLSDSVKVDDRLRFLLSSFGVLQVSEDLHSLGYPKVVCQRACLEVHLISKHVDLDACVKWIKQQADICSLDRPVNALELLKYQDLSKAVTSLLHRVPGINQQTAQIAIQQTLGDEDAAASFLTAAWSESHMPSSGDPNTMASLLLQNLPPGFNLPANSGEVVQAMAAAMAKASELQLATDRLAMAAIQSQQQIKAAMASGQLNGVTSPESLHSTITSQLALQQPQSQAQAEAGDGAAPGADPPTPDRQAMEEKLQILETHKDWADKKIGQLIKRVTEAERPQKDEAYRLRDEVHKLRQEKDVLEGKLKEFERSLQKLKDCTYQEATQKREYERRVQAVQADLRGAHLREQELQNQMEQEAAAARSERKKRENAERMFKQAAQDKAGVARILAEHEQEVAQMQMGARRQDRLAEEKLRRAEEQIAAMAQARQQLDNKCVVLSVEKASMASGLEAKDAQMESMQQEHSSVQNQLLLCQERVSQLQSELIQAQQALAVKEQQKSFYSHWNGSSIPFLDQAETRSPSSTSPPTPLALHPQPPTSQQSSQDSVSSPARPASAHASQRNVVGFPADSFASPTQTRGSQQNDQPASLMQSRIGARSPAAAAQHANSNSQSPIGSQVTHRKSSSMDSSRMASALPSNGFGHGRPNGLGGVASRGGKPSPRSQHAQHGLAGSSRDGPIASLLGLSQNGVVDPILMPEGNVRSLRSMKGLQSGSRSNLKASANGFDSSHLLPRAIHDLADLSGAGLSMAPSNGHQTNNGKNVDYAGSQDFWQHADAFQQQLRLSNIAHMNI